MTAESPANGGDAPDPETLEYKNWIHNLKAEAYLGGSDDAWFVLCNMNDILSDPDWRQWLGKPIDSLTFEARISEEWSSSLIEAVFLPRGSGFKDGDRVKVTLERLEAE